MWEERLSEFVTLLIVINPFGVLPVFLALTSGLPAAAQRRVATVATAVSFGVLLFFIAVGGVLLEKLGISLRSFQSRAASSCSWSRSTWARLQPLAAGL